MLCELIMWYPVEKIMCLFDELNTGSEWWEVQDGLPQETGLPHCFLPLHLWLDKSNVSKTVTKHPIILRPVFLPSHIWNGSGKGGSVLVGYMPVVGNPNEDASSENDSADSVKLTQFKREVYHKVLAVIFCSIKRHSRSGETVTCGDDITRVTYPGAQAKHPCPRCLVLKEFLHLLTKQFTPRTQKSMQEVYLQAQNIASHAATEDMLRNVGLHLIKNFFWQVRNYNPYRAFSWDMLHAFDSGEWGKHQWPLTLEILSPADWTCLAKNMRQMPRWRGLKHFNAVSTTDFADGNSYRDILKCILPCLINLMPWDSSLVHCIRICACLHMIARLHAVTEPQIQYISECLANYYVSNHFYIARHSKNYNYPKHHGLTHLAEDLQQKGAMENYTTHPGKGFQQEVQQAYDQTNFRDTEQQMVHIDENQEAMACIQTAIDLHDKQLQQASAAENATDDGEPPPEPEHSDQHWALGAHQKKTTPYQCIYLNYRSLEDWTVKQDILRCNPCFHSRECYDCVVINTEPMTFSSGKWSDLALIRILHPSAWIPATKWGGCTVVEEKNYHFVMLKYLLCGCHMILTFSKVGWYYLNDLVDSDAFLRFFLNDRLVY
ncbi:hypothetical protein K439DRAFT_1529313 [Ramaria rubella]|nr:hypothetical protein K439DRAFT_1529313 [Ramaria rubella]